MNNPFPSLDLRPSVIRDQLEAIYHNGMWWFTIEHALLNRTHPLKDIAKMILDQYACDQAEVLDVIPQSTINLIKQVYGY